MKINVKRAYYVVKVAVIINVAAIILFFLIFN